jgi:hypothetical protein
MEMEKIHVFARSLLSTHGDKAELEAAQKALDCDRPGHKKPPGSSFPMSMRCVKLSRKNANRLTKPAEPQLLLISGQARTSEFSYST